MASERLRVSSGVSQLDHLLGGVFIGDNVVWHDDAGSLAYPFCLNFIQASQAQSKPIIYICFDRSPKSLLEALGTLVNNPLLTILDCFTQGKGSGSEVFLSFYGEKESEFPCKIVKVAEPKETKQVMDALYGIHGDMEGDVRLVFESITGMQNLWGGEEYVLDFYSHSCPRLYDLNTIAYWILEKRAHTQRLKAKINQIAQVAIDLSMRKGVTSLTVQKAGGRNLDTLNKPFNYWRKDLHITFDDERRTHGRLDIGIRVKELRTKRGLSQTELAKLVGVTPSTISQIESNHIYPSVPALLKIAEVLFVEVNSFFQKSIELENRIIFPPEEAAEIRFPDFPKGSIRAQLLTPVDLEPKGEPYIIEIPPDKTLPSHFFIHKGDEVGYMLSGKLQLKLGRAVYSVKSGDAIYLTSDMPSQWKNPGPGVAKLLWVKIK